ncbi:MAG: hypothetical protein ACFBSF_01285 [Leptolyngbyaceae cyanobacterium]
MLAQEIQDKPPSSLTQVPFFSSRPKVKPCWRLLPIEYLSNFEYITGQFAAFGLKFEDAIAFRPSNPRFLGDRVDPRFLMSASRSRTLKVKVLKATSSMHLWLMGSEVITVSTLDDQGRCTSVAETARTLCADTYDPYTEESLTLDTRTTETLLIDSKAPFVITQFAVKQ